MTETATDPAPIGAPFPEAEPLPLDHPTVTAKIGEAKALAVQLEESEARSIALRKKRVSVIAEVVDLTRDPGASAEALGFIRQRLYQLKTADGRPLMPRPWMGLRAPAGGQ